MLHKSVMNLAKKMNKKVSNYKNMYRIESKTHICEWYLQDESAICVKVRKHNDCDDSQSDYSAGFFARTLKDIKLYLGENENV